jgi:hypothetical protein
MGASASIEDADAHLPNSGRITRAKKVSTAKVPVVKSQPKVVSPTFDDLSPQQPPAPADIAPPRKPSKAASEKVETRPQSPVNGDFLEQFVDMSKWPLAQALPHIERVVREVQKLDRSDSRLSLIAFFFLQTYTPSAVSEDFAGFLVD